MKKGKLSLLLLALTSLACMTTLPVEPPPAAIQESKPVTVYAVPTPELTRKVCLTVEAVNLRTGAGTGFESVAVLSTGDTITLTGELVNAPDRGLWWPVTVGELDGFINARYVCGK